ncbi:MAG: hypothetical protein JJU05_03850 [Verrucomicrobia bacterium]|nr:hypothetical protein [Verrucomicrobiota bacterium]MCH8526460.1 hypothetical protein [Kiritimatiellia bacterium]
MKPAVWRFLRLGKTIGVVLLVSQTTFGCASRAPSGISPSLDLRKQSDTTDHCGPTTLASVLIFHGVDLPEETISARIFSPTARGVLITDLARVAREHGFSADMRTGTLADLEETVNRGLPPIVLLDLGLGTRRVPHFTAVTGITENGVFVIGQSPADDFIPLRLFNRQWNRTENQFLLLSPSS